MYPIHEPRRAPALDATDLLVLNLSATGLLPDEVAVHLGVKPDDVRSSMARVIRELGARSKLEAVFIGLRLGLIELPGA